MPFARFLAALTLRMGATTPWSTLQIPVRSNAVLLGFLALAILDLHRFGLLARLDPTGRAVAGTPAMLMAGSAIAPFLGGTLVQFIGFEAIGYAAILFVVIQLACFNQTRRLLTAGNTAKVASPATF